MRCSPEVAQLVERTPEARGVAGSTPALGTAETPVLRALRRKGSGCRLSALLLLLTACKVYLPQCEPGTEEPERAHPGGGVTVKLSELDVDGGEL